MPIFDKAVKFVLNEEGELVDDPNDPGGVTNFGISKRAYPDIDIHNLTKDQAITIYKKDYWDRYRCSEFPPALALLIFDCAVNQGGSTAIACLQRALGVTPDGILGPSTLKALSRPTLEMCNNFVARRAVRYATSRNFNLYGVGWNARLARAHQAAILDYAGMSELGE